MRLWEAFRRVEDCPLKLVSSPMEKVPSSHTWVKFFQDAGIPESLSTQYAVMFTDHRIQRDMLSELDRDILSDIGIKAVGDKMAILKHARFISEQSKRDASSKELASGLKKRPSVTSSRSQSTKPREPLGAPTDPSLQPVPKKKIKLIATAVSSSPAVRKSPSPPVNRGLIIVPVAKTAKRSVFQRLGSSTTVIDKLGESGKDYSETPVMSSNILNRLGGDITEPPDSSTSTSQKQNIKKVVTLKKKRNDCMSQSNDMKRHSVLDRLGQQPLQDMAKDKQKAVLRADISLGPKRNRNLIKISPKHKQQVNLGKLIATAKKPISSDAVSSTSAGIFRGAAESGSSVFDRLGAK